MLGALAAMAKKNKVQWEIKRASGNWGWDRVFFEMIPNWALEKHAWLGAGLIWKGVHASSPANRFEEDAPDRTRPAKPRVVKSTEEKKAAGPLPPWKALPLIFPWDDSYKQTYHTDFEPSTAHADLSWRCPMTSMSYDDYSNPDVMHGYVSPDRPWLLSPTEIPVAGATERDPEEVRVMVYHGLTYSHSGLTDPSVMPGYVAIAKWRHERSLWWTSLEPELPRWSEVAGWFENRDWDVGKDMQACARPDGAERSMVCGADGKTWSPRPREPQPTPKSKAKPKPKSKEKKEDETSKKKRRRPDTASKGEKDENREVVNVKPKDLEPNVQEEEDQDVEAPTPKTEGERPQVADVQEIAVGKPKGVVLKSAADPAVKEKADALLGEKEPHPRVDRSASEEGPKEAGYRRPICKGSARRLR